jgi:hypothetical protein
MPRDGSNVYHYPTGIEGVPDTPVQSVPYNSFLADVEQDANLPRPILAGGSGATNADAALANFGGEKSKQGPVTNYNAFSWVNGSFYSDLGAIGSPEGSGAATAAYFGIYYEHSNTQYATIEARRLTNSGIGPLFVRQKSAGIWSAWSDADAAMDAKKVNRAGDTMTGPLNITSGGMFLTLPPFISSITLNNGIGVKRIRMGAINDLEIVNSANTAVIMSLSDSGNLLSGAIWSQISSTTGTYYFGNSGTKYLTYDGTNFTMEGGALIINGALQSTGPLTVNSTFDVFGSIKTRGALGTNFAIDATNNTVTVANGGTIATLSNFSGMVLSTCYGSGITELILCGGNTAARIGGSTGGTHTTVSFNAGAAGYSFFNNSGSTATFGLIAFRTRAGA